MITAKVWTSTSAEPQALGTPAMKIGLQNPRPSVRIPDSLPFGRTKTHHMAVCEFRNGSWLEPEIIPLGDFNFSPSGVVFHYGQQIFEGMKAYRGPSDELFLFRPEANAKRLARSAERLAMPPVPEALFLECVKELVRTEKDWIPASPGALYIRPFLIPLDEGISYRASTEYRFSVVVSPVSSYFANQAANSGLTVAIEREMCRAAPGGVGSVKCGGNYASALFAVQKARAGGATDVIWLDAKEHRFVEEVGTMNLFFYDGKTLMTPELSGSILPGVTRDSLLKLAKHMGVPVAEAKIDINDVLREIKDGTMQEVFGCGTAVVICPVEKLIDQDGQSYQLSIKNDSVASRLRESLYNIQSGRADDPFRWRVKI